ncbi:MAG: MMPL family transporter, partial [Planctomycetota bacterium]
MLAELSNRFARVIVRHWLIVLVAWALATTAIVSIAPPWKEIAYDGDFEYLPAKMNTVASARLMDQAFPGDRARSQIVFVLGRQGGDSEPLDDKALMVGDDLLRRLEHRLSEVCWKRAIKRGYRSGSVEDAPVEARPWIKRALESLDRSIDLDARFYERFAEFVPSQEPTLTEPRMAIAYYDRARLLEQIADPERESSQDAEDAELLVPGIASRVVPIERRTLASWEPLLDLLTWDDTAIGSQMTKPGARLAVAQLSNELAATGNIELVEGVSELLDRVRDYSLAVVAQAGSNHQSLRLEMTGSGAIGGETL